MTGRGSGCQGRHACARRTKAARWAVSLIERMTTFPDASLATRQMEVYPGLNQKTFGVPAIGVGSSVPLRTMRKRPSLSVTRMFPSGRNARLHGCDKPVTTGTTRIGSSDEYSV